MQTTFEDVLAAMGDPAFYPGAPGAVDVHETHISWVFVTGERAYKLKKPVVFPFLDYGSAERRREMCEREVQLNRRLAEDVYLGVRAIVLRDGRLQLGPAGAAGAIEHVVEMRRFDEADTLAGRVTSGRATAEQVAAVGRRLARFHAAAPARRRGDDALAAVKRVADGNVEALLAGGAASGLRRVLATQRFVDAFLSGHAASLTARDAAGLVRDGHGDLRAEHVLLGDGVQIVDCAEFDAELREIDVGADLAFLVMDLIRLGRPDLGGVLVDAYREAGGDPGPDHLIAFHTAVKAWVRAKVELLRGGGGASAELFALGERLAWQARLPLVLVVCGAPASGKSRLARALSGVSGLSVVGSDETRKCLRGLAPTQHAPPDAYTPQASERTYAELGRRAAEQVDRAGGVIVDATFGRSRDRRAFAAAFAGRAPWMVVECRVPADVMQARARSREQDSQRVSDAGPEIAARLRAEFEPLEDEVAAGCHVVVRTDQPDADVLEDVVAMLDRRLARPGGSTIPSGGLDGERVTPGVSAA